MFCFPDSVMVFLLNVASPLITQKETPVERARVSPPPNLLTSCVNVCLDDCFCVCGVNISCGQTQNSKGSYKATAAIQLSHVENNYF